MIKQTARALLMFIVTFLLLVPVVILRFDVDAVKIPLKPHKPDDFERLLFQRNHDADPPYLPQDLAKAEAQELRQCLEGKPCKNHPDVPDGINQLPHRDLSQGEVLESTMEPDNSESHPLLEVVVDSQATTTSLESLQELARSVDSPSPSETPMVMTPSTLVNQTRFSPSTATGVINKHGYPMNETPTTAVSDHQFPFPGDSPSATNETSHELHRFDTARSAISDGEHRDQTPIRLQKSQEQLVPHKRWQATWALNSMQMLYAIREGMIPYQTPQLKNSTTEAKVMRSSKASPVSTSHGS